VDVKLAAKKLGLTVKQYRVYALWRFGDMTQVQVGVRLNMGQPHVSMCLRRAMQRNPKLVELAAGREKGDYTRFSTAAPAA
jgi:DNA-binding MarR family transcriptional regulator